MVNFRQLQQIYNNQMDMLLASTGLTTKCLLNFGMSKKDICPNCVFDANLKKSSNRYKEGGPRPFVNGRICPFCNGTGYNGSIQVEEVYLAVIWSYKDWIIKPINIENPSGMIQTICDRLVYHKFKQCKDLTVLYHENNSNPLFKLFEDPSPAGLGDNNYLIVNWERIGDSSITANMVTPPLVGKNVVNYTYSPGTLLSVGTIGGPSAYGTYDQNGNVEEWTATKTGLAVRGLYIPVPNLKIRIGGGSVTSSLAGIKNGGLTDGSPSGDSKRGFRLSSRTNPDDLVMSLVKDRFNLYDSKTGVGSVGYDYYISKNNVTVADWCVFMNSTTSYASVSGLPVDSDTYGITKNDFLNVVDAVAPTGFPGNYVYVPSSGNADKPVVGVDWVDALRYCNWLTNGQPSGDYQTINNDGITYNPNTTEDGSYQVRGINGSDKYVSYYLPTSSGTYFLPTIDEWYKAGFYKSGSQPVTSCGKLVDGYWTYATQSDNPPTPAQTI